MLVVPSLKPLAPSPNLLRFLRSQSDSCFFTPNPTKQKASTIKVTSNRWNNGRSNWIRLSPAPCLAQIEASFLPVWPAVKISTPRKSSQLRTSLTTRSEATRSIECNNIPNHGSLRNVSTKSRRWWHNWLFKKESYQKWKNSTSPPITSFTDDGAEGNLFNLGRTLASKTLDEPRLRCTEFDENGNVTLVNGEFRKSELIAKVRLYDSLIEVRVRLHDITVRSSESRLAKDRFFRPTSHSRATEYNPYFAVTPSRSDQSGPSPCLRRIWLSRLVYTVRLHV